MNTKSRRVRQLAWVFAGFFIYLGGMEIALRVQQRLGPYYDLENPNFLSHYNKTSNLVNHTYIPETRYGFKYDQYGIRKSSPYPYYLENENPRMLFLGDSFMAGFDDKTTIPSYMWNRFQSTLADQPLAFLNAGCPSYSVVTYLIQAKYLIDVVKPTYLVVNIDEADLSNDVEADSQLIKDYSGKIVAHMASPKADMLDRMKKKFETQPLYLQRFATRLFTTQAVFPWLEELYERRVLDDQTARYFYVSRETIEKAQQLYAKEISLFRKNLQELADNIKASKFPPQKVVFSTHAHLQHFEPLDRGKVWNRLIARTIGEVAKTNGFSFYDGFPYMSRVFGDEAHQYYIPNDMHLNRKGLAAYANGLGEYLETAFFDKPNVQRQLSSDQK